MSTVRALLPAEFPAVVDWLVTLPLMQRYGLQPQAALRQFEQAAAAGELLLTVEDAAGRPAGLAWVMPRGAFGRSAYLRLIGVDPACAGAGLGSALLAEVEHHATADGRDIILLVSDFNTDAQRFYQRHGYRQVGALPGYVLPDVTELIYWKSL